MGIANIQPQISNKDQIEQFTPTSTLQSKIDYGKSLIWKGIARMIPRLEPHQSKRLFLANDITKVLNDPLMKIDFEKLSADQLTKIDFKKLSKATIEELFKQESLNMSLFSPKQLSDMISKLEFSEIIQYCNKENSQLKYSEIMPYLSKEHIAFIFKYLKVSKTELEFLFPSWNEEAADQYTQDKGQFTDEARAFYRKMNNKEKFATLSREKLLSIKDNVSQQNRNLIEAFLSQISNKDQIEPRTPTHAAGPKNHYSKSLISKGLDLMVMAFCVYQAYQVATWFMGSMPLHTNGTQLLPKPIEVHSKIIPQFCWEKNEFRQKLMSQGYWYYCPQMDFDQAKGPAHLEAMKILTNVSVQDSFYDDHPCPYGSPGYIPINQLGLLSQITNNPEIGSYLLKPEFDHELKTFNENSPAQNQMMFTKRDLIEKAADGRLNLSKLLPGSASSEDPTMIKLLKSLNGIRLAKPGDTDIALILISSPAADHNGAFGLGFLMPTSYHSWVKISEKHPIHFEEISTESRIHAVAEKVKQIFGNIKILQFYGHGDGSAIALSPYHAFTGSHPLPLDPNGVIILYSCSSGKGGIDNQNNLVNKLALQHPGVTVIGYTKDAQGYLRVIDIDQKNFKILTREGEDITYRAKACTIPLSETSESLSVKIDLC